MAYHISKDVKDLTGTLLALDGLASISVEVGKSTQAVSLLETA